MFVAVSNFVCWIHKRRLKALARSERRVADLGDGYRKVSSPRDKLFGTVKTETLAVHTSTLWV